MMNWMTFCCVAVFLSCQYSVGHGEGENVGYFSEKYRHMVVPVIQKNWVAMILFSLSNLVNKGYRYVLTAGLVYLFFVC